MFEERNSLSNRYIYTICEEILSREIHLKVNIIILREKKHGVHIGCTLSKKKKGKKSVFSS